MCVMIDSNLRIWAESGGVSPYESANVNPASIDLVLGYEVIDLNTRECFSLDNGGLKLYHGKSVLAHTHEYVRIPPHMGGMVLLKSTLARSGLDHAMAGWIDPGFQGQITLELSAHRDLVLYPLQRIVQLILYSCNGIPAQDYSVTGRYHKQVGATPARPDKEV